MWKFKFPEGRCCDVLGLLSEKMCAPNNFREESVETELVAWVPPQITLRPCLEEAQVEPAAVGAKQDEGKELDGVPSKEGQNNGDQHEQRRNVLQTRANERS